MGTGSHGQILLGLTACVSFTCHIVFRPPTVHCTLLASPLNLVLSGSSLVFPPPGLSCTRAGVTFVLFADPESGDSFSSRFASLGDAQHTPVTLTLVPGHTDS